MEPGLLSLPEFNAGVVGGLWFGSDPVDKQWGESLAGGGY